MTAVEQQLLARKLRYIIHCGFTDIRSLSGVAGSSRQIHDLADAMEVLPRYFAESIDEDLELIRFVLSDYQNRYPEGRDYLKYLDWHEIPDRY